MSDDLPINLEFLLPVSLLNCFTLPMSKGDVPNCNQNSEILLTLPVNARGADFMGRFYCPSDSKDNVLSSIVRENPNPELDVFGVSTFQSGQVPFRFIMTGFDTEPEINGEHTYFVTLCSGSRSNIVSKPLDLATIRKAVNLFGKELDSEINDLEPAFKYLIRDVMLKEPALNGCNDPGTLREFIQRMNWGDTLQERPGQGSTLPELRQFIQDNIAYTLKIVGSPIDGQHRTVGYKICFENLVSDAMDAALMSSIHNYSLEPTNSDENAHVRVHIPVTTITPESCQTFRTISAQVQRNNSLATDHGIFMYLGLILDGTRTSFATKPGSGRWLLQELRELLITMDVSVHYWIKRDGAIEGKTDPDDLSKQTLTIEATKADASLSLHDGDMVEESANNELYTLLLKFARMKKNQVRETPVESKTMQEYYQIIWRNCSDGKTVDRQRVSVTAAVTALIHAWTEALMACIFNVLQENHSLLPKSLNLFVTKHAPKSFDDCNFVDDLCKITRRISKKHPIHHPVPLLVHPNRRIDIKFQKDFVLEPTKGYFYDLDFRDKKFTDSMVDLVMAVLLAFLSEDSFYNTVKFVSTKSLMTPQAAASDLSSEQKWLRSHIHLVAISTGASTASLVKAGYYQSKSKASTQSRLFVKDILPAMFQIPQALAETGSFLHSFGLNPSGQYFGFLPSDLNVQAQKVVNRIILAETERGKNATPSLKTEVTKRLMEFLQEVFTQNDVSIDILPLIFLFYSVYHLGHVFPSKIENQNDLLSSTVLHSSLHRLATRLAKEDRASSPNSHNQPTHSCSLEDYIDQIVKKLKSLQVITTKAKANQNQALKALDNLTVGKDQCCVPEFDPNLILDHLQSMTNISQVKSSLESNPHMVLSLIQSLPDHPLVTNSFKEWFKTVQKPNVEDFITFICFKFLSHKNFSKSISTSTELKAALKNISRILQDQGIEPEKVSKRKQLPR